MRILAMLMMIPTMTKIILTQVVTKIQNPMQRRAQKALQTIVAVVMMSIFVILLKIQNHRPVIITL